MYIIIWEFRVKAEHRSKFEKLYSPNGAWAELFKTDREYIGTELLQDASQPQRYLTVDRWTSKTAYEHFLAQQEKAYRALDEQCEDLTEHESCLGKFSEGGH